jgi:hypothetical protein
MQEVCRPVKPAVCGVALACVGVALAACTMSPSERIGGAARARPALSRSVPSTTACPAGRLLQRGGRVEIEWVDFLQFDGRQYVAGLGPVVTIGPDQLGPVVTRVRCSLAASDDHRHVGIPLVDGSAAFLPAGSAVFEVRGYSPRCRLAGYVDGRLHVYLAQRDLHGQSAPLRCAL